MAKRSSDDVFILRVLASNTEDVLAWERLPKGARSWHRILAWHVRAAEEDSATLGEEVVVVIDNKAPVE